MRAAWKGFITLGQLGIPVRLYSALQSARPDFVLLHEKDGSPVERVLRVRNTNKEVPSSEVVRGIEYQPGRYITLTADELAQADASDSKTIDIKQFSDAQDISPSYYTKSYYAVPVKGGERSYGLLRDALLRSRKVAISQFKAYGRERIGVISNLADLLVVYQLSFAAEIVPRSQIKSPAIPKASPGEIEMLTEVIKRYSGPFYIQDYRDEQTDRINELLERKIKGLPLPRSRKTAPKPTSEEDLLPVLRSTLENAGKTISASTRKPAKMDSKQLGKGVENATTGSRTKR